MSKSARHTLRYLILRSCYQRGWMNVPLIGPKADGRRDCAPGFQAEVDTFGTVTPPGAVSLCKSTISFAGRHGETT